MFAYSRNTWVSGGVMVPYMNLVRAGSGGKQGNGKANVQLDTCRRYLSHNRMVIR